MGHDQSVEGLQRFGWPQRTDILYVRLLPNMLDPKTATAGNGWERNPPQRAPGPRVRTPGDAVLVCPHLGGVLAWLLGSWTSGTDLGGAACVRRAFRAFACRVGTPKSAWAEKEGARGGSLSFYLCCHLSRPLSLSHTVAVLCVCKKHSCHRNEDSVGNPVLGTDDYRCRRTQLEKPPGGRDICVGVMKAFTDV